jgi:two-component system sensor histidine kinase DesK
VKPLTSTPSTPSATELPATPPLAGAAAPAAAPQETAALDRSTRQMGYWFLAYLLIYPLPWLGRPPSVLDIAASAVGVAVFLPLYLAGFGRSDARALRCGLAVAAIGLALQPFGGIWGVFIVYACGLLGGLLPRRRATGAVAAVAAAVAALVLWRDIGLGDWLPTLFFSAMTTMVSVYSAAYAAQSAELAASRDEARRLAVVAERERIARDLHDLLGHTLTAVAVKADLAGRLIDADPARAKAEIEDIRRTARTALADVRAAVTGMRSTRLATELATARRALDSAGITLRTEGVPPVLPPEVETALAFVLLEGVTNVVRHAQARQCEVTFTREGGGVVLRIRDSREPPGPAATPDPPAVPVATSVGGPLAPAQAPEGHGIAGMRQRLAAVGGTLALQFKPAGSVLVAFVPQGPGGPAP